MDIRVKPCSLAGSVSAPLSKSEFHRVLICSALSDRETAISCTGNRAFQLPDDIKATISCLESLGAKITVLSDSVTVTPIDRTAVPERPVLDCKSSAATLRFLIPGACALNCSPSFTGSALLARRPVADILSCLSDHGIVFTGDRLPFSACGEMTGGEFFIPGNISSQYLSGLLMALPIMEPSSVTVTTDLYSSGYVSVTRQVMSGFGVDISCEGRKYMLSSERGYMSPSWLNVGGDWSGAAVLLTAGLICGNSAISVDGLDIFSEQADKAIISILNSMRGTCAIGNEISTRYGHLRGAEIDMNENPDLFPILAVAASVAEGTSRFTGVERLRVKESDRIDSVISLVTSLGGNAVFCDGDVIIRGVPSLKGGIIDTFSDHRIAMAGVIAAAASREGAVIKGAECISKSWPDFLECFRSLGGEYDVI